MTALIMFALIGGMCLFGILGCLVCGDEENARPCTSTNGQEN